MKNAKIQKVYMGVSKKFGFAIWWPGNIILAFSEEWNNCHKLIEKNEKNANFTEFWPNLMFSVSNVY